MAIFHWRVRVGLVLVAVAVGAFRTVPVRAVDDASGAQPAAGANGAPDGGEPAPGGDATGSARFPSAAALGATAESLVREAFADRPWRGLSVPDGLAEVGRLDAARVDDSAGAVWELRFDPASVGTGGVAVQYRRMGDRAWRLTEQAAAAQLRGGVWRLAAETLAAPGAHEVRLVVLPDWVHAEWASPTVVVGGAADAREALQAAVGGVTVCDSAVAGDCPGNDDILHGLKGYRYHQFGLVSPHGPYRGTVPVTALNPDGHGYCLNEGIEVTPGGDADPVLVADPAFADVTRQAKGAWGMFNLGGRRLRNVEWLGLVPVASTDAAGYEGVRFAAGPLAGVTLTGQQRVAAFHDAFRMVLTGGVLNPSPPWTVSTGGDSPAVVARAANYFAGLMETHGDQDTRGLSLGTPEVRRGGAWIGLDPDVALFEGPDDVVALRVRITNHRGRPLAGVRVGAVGAGAAALGPAAGQPLWRTAGGGETFADGSGRYAEGVTYSGLDGWAHFRWAAGDGAPGADARVSLRAEVQVQELSWFEGVTGSQLNVDLAAATAHATDLELVAASVITVVKVDADTGDALSGARFALRRDADGDGSFEVDHGVHATDADGTVAVSGLVAGVYELRETQPPPGYELPADRRVEVELTPGAAASVRVTNQAPAVVTRVPRSVVVGRADGTVELVDDVEVTGVAPSTEGTLVVEWFRRNGDGNWVCDAATRVGTSDPVTTRGAGVFRVGGVRAPPGVDYTAVETWAGPFTEHQGACGLPAETVSTMAVSTTAAATVVQGELTADVVQVTNAPADLAATVTFALYGPFAADDDGAPVDPVCDDRTRVDFGGAPLSIVVVGSGAFAGTAVPTADLQDGAVYTWVETYQAVDHPDVTVTGTCGRLAETTRVVAPLPTPTPTPASSPTPSPAPTSTPVAQPSPSPAPSSTPVSTPSASPTVAVRAETAEPMPPSLARTGSGVSGPVLVAMALLVAGVAALGLGRRFSR